MANELTMSLTNRIFSLETEYALNFYPKSGGARYTNDHVAKAIIESVVNERGNGQTQFLSNGSRLYYDVGHVEWSLPECIGCL